MIAPPPPISQPMTYGRSRVGRVPRRVRRSLSRQSYRPFVYGPPTWSGRRRLGRRSRGMYPGMMGGYGMGMGMGMYPGMMGFGLLRGLFRIAVPVVGLAALAGLGIFAVSVAIGSTKFTSGFGKSRFIQKIFGRNRYVAAPVATAGPVPAIHTTGRKIYGQPIVQTTVANPRYY